MSQLHSQAAEPAGPKTTAHAPVLTGQRGRLAWPRTPARDGVGHHRAGLMCEDVATPRFLRENQLLAPGSAGGDRAPTRGALGGEQNAAPSIAQARRHLLKGGRTRGDTEIKLTDTRIHRTHSFVPVIHTFPEEESIPRPLGNAPWPRNPTAFPTRGTWLCPLLSTHVPFNSHSNDAYVECLLLPARNGDKHKEDRDRAPALKERLFGWQKQPITTRCGESGGQACTTVCKTPGEMGEGFGEDKPLESHPEGVQTFPKCRRRTVIWSKAMVSPQGLECGWLRPAVWSSLRGTEESKLEQWREDLHRQPWRLELDPPGNGQL